MEFIKAFHNVLVKQKRKSGTRAYYSGGEVYFSRLFGYRLVGDRYEPDPRYAPAIRMIFEMLAEQKTLIEIKKTLDEVKVRDSSNNRYSLSRISAIASRPVYSGYINQHGRLAKINNLIPLVSLETWKQAQKTLQVEKKKMI